MWIVALDNGSNIFHAILPLYFSSPNNIMFLLFSPLKPSKKQAGFDADARHILLELPSSFFPFLNDLILLGLIAGKDPLKNMQ